MYLLCVRVAAPRSARPSRRASIAAAARGRPPTAPGCVRPSFKTGLHCGHQQLGAGHDASPRVRPSFKTGLHCGVATWSLNAGTKSGPPVLQDGPPLRRDVQWGGAAVDASPPVLQDGPPLRLGDEVGTRGAPTVRPSFKTGLHCGQIDCAASPCVLAGPPVLQDGPPLRQEPDVRGEGCGDRSARPSRRASIAAHEDVMRRVEAIKVRPSFKTGLHCGSWRLPAAASSAARVRPSFKTGLHCGDQSKLELREAYAVRPSFKTGLHCGGGEGRHVGDVTHVRPSFKTGLHCGYDRFAACGLPMPCPPVLQDGPPLRREIRRLGRHLHEASARPSRRASIAASSHPGSVRRGSRSARPSRRASIAAPGTTRRRVGRS
ncbi:MAG: hypothetical protein QOE45_1423 [Frankiaceae bacterium]|nr:hypothetical protein [Frankiaceae bacterium]